MSSHKVRRLVGVVLVAAVVSMGAAACDVRVAGKRCSVPNATAQDATHLLVCQGGRWTRSLTKVQIALILLATIQAQTPVTVASGNGNTCAAMENADVRCWGFNSSGQLGNGTTTNSSTPAKPVGPQARNSADVASVAPFLPLGGKLTVGAEFGCVKQFERFAATNNSKAFCWGFNGFGQLGDGTTTNRSTSVQAPGNGVGDIAAGTVHTCASVAFVGITCWGQNAGGQVGDGTTNPTATPTLVSGLANKTGAVAAGGSHSCALVGAALSCWGGNGSGQLGDGTTTQRLTPVAVTLAGIGSIDAGGEETCAALADGTARCWGSNGSGQLGDGSTTNRSTPTAVSGLSGVTQISVGQDHACAIVADGGVRCWGSNASGQLGDGTTTSHSAPVVVPGITKATSISAGFGHTCAVADKKTFCWGRNDFGQLGDGTTTERHSPVQVKF